MAREQPLQNKNRPLCQCERTRKYQQEWRARNPNYMKIKGREWRARRKAQREAIERQIVEGQRQ
jgi:shikimate kinase